MHINNVLEHDHAIQELLPQKEQAGEEDKI